MELWRGDIPEFLDAVQSRSIVPQMLRQFDRWHGGTPSPSEVKSWEVSLTALGSVVDGQASDVGVSVEYHLPLSGQRIDVMFLGRDCHQQANAVVVELKHWDTVNIEDEFSMNVLVGDAEHLHRSARTCPQSELRASLHRDHAWRQPAPHRARNLALHPLCRPRLQEFHEVRELNHQDPGPPHVHRPP